MILKLITDRRQRATVAGYNHHGQHTQMHGDEKLNIFLLFPNDNFLVERTPMQVSSAAEQ